MSAGAVQSVRDVIYRDVAGDRQTLDVLTTSGAAPAGGRPVIVAIHGGIKREDRRRIQDAFRNDPTVRKTGL